MPFIFVSYTLHPNNEAEMRLKGRVSAEKKKKHMVSIYMILPKYAQAEISIKLLPFER